LGGEKLRMQMVTDTIASVMLPKYVSINDFRVGLLYKTLQIGSVAWVVYSQFIAGGIFPWHETTVPLGRQTAWISEYDDVYDRQVLNDEMADFCSNSEKYTYCYEPNCAGRIFNFGQGQQGFTCETLDFYDAFIKQESGNGYLFFLHTFTKRTDTHRIAVPKNSDGSCSGSCSSAKIIEMCPDEYGGGEYSETGKMTPARDKCLCECSIEQDVFVKGVEGLKLSMSHKTKATTIRNTKPYDEMYSSNTKALVDDGYGDNDGLLTVLMANGEVVDIFAPGAVVGVPIKNLLNYAGVTLESESPNDAKNYATGDVTSKAIARLVGVDVTLSMKYYNSEDANFRRYFPKDYADKDDYNIRALCIVEVKAVPNWESRIFTDYTDRKPGGAGTFQNRYSYNIKLTITATGSFSYINLLGVSTSIAAVLVYLGLPGALIGPFTKYALGTKSVVYKAAQQEELVIEKLFTGIIAQGLVASATYDHIVGATGEEDPGLHTDQLNIALRRMFKEAGIIASDADLAVVRGALAARMQEKQRTAGTKVVPGSPDSHKKLSRKDFVDLVLDHNLVDMDLVSHYYDAEGLPKGCMERIFTATKSNDLVEQLRKQQTQGGDAGRLSMLGSSQS
jgi:hypothetical protein